MTTSEQDPYVVQRGIQLFDCDPYANYHGQYFKEDHHDTECCNVENDELVAHALQEELSQLSVVKEQGSPNEGQVSGYQQDGVCQSIGNYGSGQDCGQEEQDDVGPSSSWSRPKESLYHKDDLLFSLDLTDECALDGEVGKMLNQMVPVPHVPRINGEIPSVDVATSDHQRLLERLQLYNLVELKVQGDGNCQFRALSDQFYRTPEHHEFVRQQVVNQLKSCPEIYEGYVPMAYNDYLEKMSRSGEWGDHVTLQAAADSYGVKIFVITSFKDTCYIEILPNVPRSKRVIFLSFWAEVHYNSIYPFGDVPTFGTKKKKRRQKFNKKHSSELPDEYQECSDGRKGHTACSDEYQECSDRRKGHTACLGWLQFLIEVLFKRICSKNPV
ncbi:hypothetical protein SLE2022_285670 [Rubroshorea leprosula]